MYSADDDEYFNVDMNDDRFSVEGETGHVGQNSIKLMISQLRLTCIELKVALKLQGTNFLLHIDQLKHKHETLHTEMKRLKRLIRDKNISDVSQNTGLSVNLSQENITNQSHTDEFEDTDINSSNNVSQLPKQIMEVLPKISIDATKCSTVERVQELCNPYVQNNLNESRVLNDSRLIEKAALCDVVSEHIKNYADYNNEKSADAHEKSYTPPLSEALSQECVVQSSTFYTDDSNSLADSHQTRDILTLNITTSPRTSDESIYKEDNTVQNVAITRADNFNSQPNYVNSSKMKNFSNIKDSILKKLTETFGEKVKTKQILRISENNYNSIINKVMDENCKIIQICLYDEGNYSVRFINKNEVPKTQAIKERFYMVEFKINGKKKVNGKMQHIELLNNVNSINDSVLDKDLSDHNTIVENISSDAEFINHTNHTITTSADVHHDPGISKLKRKSNGDIDVQCKNKKGDLSNNNPIVNSSCVSSTSIFDNEIYKKSFNSSINNANEIRVDNTNNASIFKPIILSNQIIKGNYYIKKLMDKDIQDFTEDICLPGTEKSRDHSKNTSMTDTISKRASLKCNDIIENRENNEKSQLKKGKGSNLILSKNIENSHSAIGHISKTKTNHNGIKYQNNSTQQSFQSLMHQSSFDLSVNDFQDNQQINYDISRIPVKSSAGIIKVPTILRRKKKNTPIRNSIYVRTEKRQLTTLPSVTLREHRTWNIDEDVEEIIDPNYIDDDVSIIEVVNTPIIID